MCTHLHVDHVGWNTRLDNGKWVPTFPNAKYVWSKTDFDYFSGIDREREFPGGMFVEPAPGHTPGHFMVGLAGGGREAVLSGDLMHHPLQLRYPDWSTRFCVDPAQARETRKRFLAAHAGSNRIVFPAHFPGPVGGCIRADGDHYGFEFCRP
jgi:glyoxylase-like metal-dependent hydrolase (beta-lactamase superfamily II)